MGGTNKSLGVVIKRFLKNNRFIRGFVFGYRQVFSYPRKRFGFLSKEARFSPSSRIIGPQNVFIYSDICLSDVTISALNARFIVKKGCAIAGGLTVITGNHARVIGRFIGSITELEKPCGLDADVIINEDVWVGCNVTILSGVTVGRGTTIAAGSVVTKSLPPYCICAGVPAKVIKRYWTIEEIVQHERIIYDETNRLKIEELREI